jgi:hypothetical protein
VNPSLSFTSNQIYYLPLKSHRPASDTCTHERKTKKGEAHSKSNEKKSKKIIG